MADLHPLAARTARSHGPRAIGEDRPPVSRSGPGRRLRSLPMASAARKRAVRAAAGPGIDVDLVVRAARDLGVMGWVRPTGEVHAEGP